MASERYDNDRNLQIKYSSKLKYIKEYFIHDIQIQSAIALIIRYSSKKVIDSYFTAKVMNKPRQRVTLSTAHTSKGYEFDCVYIEDDLNMSIEKAIVKKIVDPEENLSPIYLYYTACTRAKKELINATALKSYIF
jgi:superfamily I DNA/RNA helicase